MFTPWFQGVFFKTPLIMRIVLLLFFISIQINSQNTQFNKEIDSILYYLDSAKANNKISFANKAIRICYEVENDTLLRRAAIKLGLNSYYNKDTFGLKKANESLIHLYKKNNDSIALAKRYHFKALMYRIQNRLDSSYYYYNRSKDISVKLGDSLQAGIRLKSMADMQNSERDYIGAQSTIIRALEYLEPLKNETVFKRDSYNILGNILTNTGQYEESRKYFEKAGETFSEDTSEWTRNLWRVQLLNNIGYSYLSEKNYVKALEYFEKGLSFPNVQETYKITYKLLLENAAPCKYALGRKEEAWRDFNKLLKLREKEDTPYRISRTHNNFAYYYMLEGENEKALYHAKKSYDLSKKSNHNFMTQMSLQNLALLTSGKESKNYIKEYISLRDKLYQREVSLKEQFALVRYETEKKDKLNTILKAESEQQRQQKIISWLFSLAAVLGLILSFMFFRARRKKLMYEAQLQKASAREEERQQIAKSLHDEVAGDLRMLHRKLAKTDYQEEAKNLDTIKENVRNLSHQLSSVSFEEVSFKDQIINLVADNFSPSFRISVEGIDTVLWETVNSAIKRTLYLCTRESLQNTQKYAEASKFFIRFSSEKREILLLLEDNGNGFELNKGKKGIGLKNLKERVEEIQGSFHIETSDQGTKTTISIPINGR
jgi:signal transduction histidine kinase